MNTLARRTLGMLGVVILVGGSLAAYKVHSLRELQRRLSAMRPPPAVVSTAIATETPWQRRLHAVGTLAAVQGVTVSGELPGTVAAIAFESGHPVNKGDLLVQLDTSTDEAQLRGLRAQAELASLTRERARELRAANTNSQADLDAAQAQYREASAAVQEIRSVIAKKTIRAPFSGVLGIRLVDVGQYLPPGGAIVALQAMDPIYADFTLPQQDAGELAPGQPVRVTVDAYPGAVFEGVINARDSKVDPATRNLSVQALLRNADGRLLPGMFAVVDVLIPARDRYVTLPETAIVYTPYGSAV